MLLLIDVVPCIFASCGAFHRLCCGMCAVALPCHPHGALSRPARVVHACLPWYGVTAVQNATLPLFASHDGKRVEKGDMRKRHFNAPSLAPVLPTPQAPASQASRGNRDLRAAADTTLALSPHTHARTHTHACTHARTHTCTYTCTLQARMHTRGLLLLSLSLSHSHTHTLTPSGLQLTRQRYSRLQTRGD